MATTVLTPELVRRAVEACRGSTRVLAERTGLSAQTIRRAMRPGTHLVYPTQQALLAACQQLLNPQPALPIEPVEIQQPAVAQVKAESNGSRPQRRRISERLLAIAIEVERLETEHGIFFEEREAKRLLDEMAKFPREAVS